MEYKITNKAIDKLKYDLVREGLLDYNQLVEAIELAREKQTNLGQILIQDNIISEENLLNFLEQKLHIPYVNLDDYTIDTKSLGLISEEDARKYKIIPLFVIEETLTTAMADPLDLFALNNLSISSNYNVEPVICSERSILKAIDNFYKSSATRVTGISEKKPTDLEIKQKFDWQSELNEDKTDEVNIYRLVRAIIYQAIHEKASDIHFDPQRDELIVRFRIDGLLHNRGCIPILLAPECISKIKSAAGLDLNEVYFPQHGRMEVNVDKNSINARVSTFPINYGEKIVIKIFPKAPILDSLGFENNQLELFKRALNKGSGIIIAAGPLGSGQTTTMYSALEYINSEHKNIMTIESPIRYNIDKINQTQINLAKNFNLETALKDILLQEPDVIYIDEVPNNSNIELIVKAALAGHYIITSLIADSTIGVLYRLMSLGIDINLISTILNAVFSQKLIRTLCKNCKTRTEITTNLAKKFNLPEDITYYTSKGCKQCNSTGYQGRDGIFEVLSINEDILNQVAKGNKEAELLAYLKDTGHKTLLDVALNKVKNGATSIDEVERLLKL